MSSLLKGLSEVNACEKNFGCGTQVGSGEKTGYHADQGGKKEDEFPRKAIIFSVALRMGRGPQRCLCPYLEQLRRVWPSLEGSK